MPACHAGDRRFESGRVRHDANPSDAPFARPNGASLLPPSGSRRARTSHGLSGTFGARTNRGARGHPSAVIGSIGSRLRLVLRQPGAADATDQPEIDFVAYSTSERLSGRVRVGGPRGDRGLRIPTAKHRLVLRSGRYLIAGRLHSNHGEDPLAALRRREPMVPLTDASIMFRVGTDIVEEPAGTIVVNRDLVEWVREGELDARTFDLPA